MSSAMESITASIWKRELRSQQSSCFCARLSASVTGGGVR
jgi:hypothetical protein